MNDHTESNELHLSLKQIPVPVELDDRISDTIKQAARARMRRRRLRTATAACIASIIGVSVLLMALPPVATFAERIPGFRIVAGQLKQWGAFAGLNHAQQRGYEPMKPVTATQGDFAITLDNLYLFEGSLIYTASVTSDEIQAWEDAGKLNEPGKPLIQIRSKDFGLKAGRGSERTERDEETGKVYRVIQEQLNLGQDEVDAFLASNPSRLTFEIGQGEYGRTEPTVKSILELAVPFKARDVLKEKAAAVHAGLGLERADSDIAASTLQSFTIDPMRMTAVVDTAVKQQAGRPYFLTSGLDIESAGRVAFQSQTRSYEEELPYLTDENGNRYPVNEINEGWDGKDDLIFVPSVYFDDFKELTLHVQKVWVSGPIAGSIEVSMKGPFPQTIDYRGEPLKILGARYEEGCLVLKLERDRKQLPFYVDEPGIEPGISGGTLLMASDYWKDFQRSEADRKPDRPEYKFYVPLTNVSFGHLGFFRPNLTEAPSDDESAYEIRVPAPEQSSYKLDIVRFDDPVDVDISIPIKLSSH
ncbi:hypothetical protein ACFFSY_18365 [Paenibacillus aurantiacus]|uniref:DUF4179 domain-containing protein n=1 Tax=Paenibacillus aurantiacus TaxID=1936118 RepID=A0ABV5KTJ2_9BACL